MSPNRIRFSAVILIVVATGLIAGCAKPKVKLQVSRDRIQQGEDVRVTWESKDAKTVTLNGEQVDKVGSKVYTPSQNTTYLAIARRGKKEAKDSKNVEVSSRAARPTISISAEPGAINRGASTTLKWDSTAADRVSITDLGTVPASGSRTVSPSDSTTYTATATGPGGTDTASTRVTVTADADESRPLRVNTPSPAIAAIFSQWVKPIYFEYDKAELRFDAQETLRRAADWLTKGTNRSIVFRIEGHCDPRGTEEYNFGLGERRAQMAREFLVSLGVDQSRIQTVSYGKERAVGTYEGSPGDQRAWANDRRDDFIYVSGGASQ